MSKISTRGISMSDEMYEECLTISGKNFSAWARQVFQYEIDKNRAIPGRTPGGTCVMCNHAVAWLLNTVKHNYWCKSCATKADLVAVIDRTPVAVVGASKREQLLQAVVRAARALTEYDELVAATRKPLPESA